MDVRQVITDRIISIMERGTQDFRALWARAAAGGVPRNGKTGKAYSGVNVLTLWAAAEDAGYTDPVWMTFKQAQELGASVRKGEKGTLCVYFEMVTRKGEAGAEDDDNAGFYPMAKAFWVFNVAQIDNLPAELQPKGRTDAPAFCGIEHAEQFLAATGANIIMGGNRAFYRPASDAVHMPEREQFYRPEDFYAVAAHELSHWTGAAHRLNRVKGSRFGDEAYAMEELVAELSASFICGQLGILDASIENHASYLDSWLIVLKRDKNAIFTAARLASQAADYLNGNTAAATATAAN